MIDGLKLTAYFGERDRGERGLLADELIDSFSAREVELSVLLRGIEGFGTRHRVHTDRLLTLSEDLPVIAVAVDTVDRIEAVLDDVRLIERHGLVTLERARLVSTPSPGPAAAGFSPGEAAKLTVYVGRRERAEGRPAFVTVCDVLHRYGLDGATVLLGVDGTHRGLRQRARFFSGNGAVPMMIVAVGGAPQVAAAAAAVRELLRDPLLTFERVRVCKRDGRRLEAPHALPAVDEHGLPLWQKLTVYSSERARHGRQPLHRALTRRLLAAEAAGATTLRGVWGFHGDHRPHGDKLLQTHRHVPVLTTAIDAPDRIAQVFSIIDELTGDGGLVTSELVPAAGPRALRPLNR
jgi:PII-like signaling protein